MLNANSYFEGNVQSIAGERNGRKESVGMIAPGSYHFGTEAAERMSVISGEFQIKKDGSDTWVTYPAGTAFEVGANSGFDISCSDTSAYRCEYL